MFSPTCYITVLIFSSISLVIQDNVKTTTTQGILCYNCDNCNDLTANTPVVRCPDAECCYRAAVKNNSASLPHAIRGCHTLTKDQHCQNVCHYVLPSHLKQYPNGSLIACVSCDRGDRNYCNHEKLVVPKAAIIWSPNNTGMRCYKCTNCLAITSTTINIQCPTPKCCYAGFIKNETSGRRYAVRDCATQQYPCDNICEYLTRNYHLTNQTLEQCFPCAAGDRHECNSKTFEPPPTAKQNISCYACSNCNVVTALSGMVECADSRCCYRALLKRHQTETLFAVRGCARMRHGVSCERTCQYIEANHYTMHPRGHMHVCVQCKVGAGDACNNRTFHTGIEKKDPSSIMCYDCTNCSQILWDTPKIECRSARCCYSAYLNDQPHGRFYAIRGCARWRRSRLCVDTCKDVQQDHGWSHAYGTFKKCFHCGFDDTDGCNMYPYIDEPTEVKPRYNVVPCYSCKQCNQVDAHTEKIVCSSPSCCYIAFTAKTMGDFVMVDRGCMKGNQMGICPDACKEVKNEYNWNVPNGQFLRCITCTEGALGECNGQRFDSPPVTKAEGYGTPTTSTSMMCYKCRNCNRVDKSTEMVQCPYSKCCYIVVLQDNKTDTPVASRGCAESKLITRCYDTCGDIKKNHYVAHPSGSFGFCLTCNDMDANGCNDNVYHPKSLQPGSFQCYECVGCYEITPEVGTTYCAEQCCSAVVWREDGVIKSARQCADLKGKPCGDYCKALNVTMKKIRRDDEIYSCCACKTNNCNDAQLIIPDADIHTDGNLRRILIESSTRAGLFISNRENEFGLQLFANESNNEIEAELLKSKKSTSKTDFDITIESGVTENSRDDEEQSLIISTETNLNEEQSLLLSIETDLTTIASDEEQSLMISSENDLTTIASDNEEQPILLSTDFTESSTAISNTTIECYDCMGCYSIPFDANIVACESGCCYTVLWKENLRETVTRQCADHGKTCKETCSEHEEALKKEDQDGTILFCQTCEMDKCNDHVVASATYS